MSWIDIPVVQAIEYFSGVLAFFFKLARRYGTVVGIVGLSWSAFKLVNNRMKVRDLWWDTFYKWLLFLLFINLYIPVTAGISRIANRIGIEAGNGKQAIISSLTDVKNAIEKDLKTQRAWADGLETELSTSFDGITFETDFGNSESYDDYIDSLLNEVAVKFNAKNTMKKAQHIIDTYKEKNRTHKMLFSGKTLAAIENVLVPKNPDGSAGDSLLNSYVDLNIWLKDNQDNDTYYLSPAALLRVALLGCQVMWEKDQSTLSVAYDDIDEVDEKGFAVIKKPFEKMGTFFKHIPVALMTIFCCIVLILSVIFAEIQYVMTILEYTIIVGIGAFFIPFILFDGTKDMPKKLVPVFTAFLIKMIVMTICLFFVFYIMIQGTVEIIKDTGGMNWIQFASQCFNCVMCFFLTQNAPKIAQTILTGQPQLSMGEFMAAAGTAGVLARGYAKAGVAGTRKAINTGINTAGNVKRGIHTAKTANASAQHSVAEKMAGTGASRAEVRQTARSAGLKAGAAGFVDGMFAQPSKDLVNSIKAKGNDFLHGKTSSSLLGKALGAGEWNGNPGGVGGGKGGVNPYAEDLREAYFNTAKNADGTNMTIPQFMNRAANSETAQKIGDRYADKALQRAEKEKSKNRQSSQLPENLTGGIRASVE